MLSVRATQKSRDDQGHYGYAMACIGDWALVCCGHSHQAEERKVATLKSDETWLVNPGTVTGLAAPGAWALGDLATMRAELRELGSQTGRSLTTSGCIVRLLPILHTTP
jgi:predicted phosphodiesterase